jgi:hypothetical protein
MHSNELYLAVLPLIRVPSRQLGVLGITSGSVQQFITLFPDENFATEFFPDEVQFYIDTFKATLQFITGGHVKSYEFFPQETSDGRVRVLVVQHVS